MGGGDFYLKLLFLFLLFCFFTRISNLRLYLHWILLLLLFLIWYWVRLGICINWIFFCILHICHIRLFELVFLLHYIHLQNSNYKLQWRLKNIRKLRSQIYNSYNNINIGVLILWLLSLLLSSKLFELYFSGISLPCVFIYCIDIYSMVNVLY